MDILRILRRQRGWSQKEIAARVGVSRGAVAMWESGRSSPDAEMLVKLAQLFGTTVDTLLGASRKEDGVCRFAVVDSIRLDSKESVPRQIATSESVDIPASWLHSLPTEEFLVLRADGDSMWPDIHDGDLLLVQRGELVPSGHLALVLHPDGKSSVRRLEFSPGGGYLDLVSRNPEYAPKRLQGPGLDALTIYGEVVSIIRNLKP